MTPPHPVVAARWLWIGSALLGAVRFVLQLADRQVLVAEMRKAQPQLSQDALDGAVSGGVLFGVLLAGALVTLYTVLATRMAQGRNWARVALTVLGGASVLFGLARLVAVVSGTAATVNLVISPVDLAFIVVTTLLDATALTLMFLPVARTFFNIATQGDRRMTIRS
jgi:hypothetical protein